MNVYEAIRKRRSIRKFKQQEVGMDVLKRLADAARVAPTGANLQPVKYLIVDDKKLCSQIFETVKWAAYIKPDGDPAESERPTAYIAVLCDTEIKKSDFGTDVGACVENILLAAVEEGLGTCWMGAIDRGRIREILNIPARYELHTVIALGYPAEEPVSEDESGSIKYYKDEVGVLHVPKRKLDDLVFLNNDFI